MVDDVRTDRAYFDGLILGCLAFGALMILYFQLIQVLLSRPKRSGRFFWGIIVYSAALFPLATGAFTGKIKFAELMYVTNRLQPSGPMAYSITHSEVWCNAISQVSATLIPWVGDTLMLYRLIVFWNTSRWIIFWPGLLYSAHIAISIPLLICQTWPNTIIRHSHLRTYRIIFYSISIALNLTFTILICLRIFIMRNKAVKVLGKLQAGFYISSITMFVESGGFITIWCTIYFSTLLSDSWAQAVFLQPYSCILAITRMLIIMRMARDHAWTEDIIAAAVDGDLEWQIASKNTTGSIVLHNIAFESPNALSQKFMGPGDQ